MRPELETYQLIDKFLLGKLRGEELESFNNKMLTDSSFKEEVDYQKMVNEVVNGASMHQLRETISNDIKKIDKGIVLKKWWISSAIILFLLGSTSLYYTLTKNSAKIVTNQQQNSKENPTIKSIPETKIAASKQLENKSLKSTNEILVVEQGTNNQKNITPNIPLTNEENPVSTFSQKEEKPISTTEKIIPLDKCATIRIQAELISQATCIGENKGAINIDPLKISGGKQPYSISKGSLQAKESNPQFYGLNAGNHIITIEDADGCKVSYQVKIEEEICKKTKFKFTPDLGETWKFPGNENEEFTITISNRGGQTVYKTTVPVGSPAEWAGQGIHGENLETGLYIYIIEYTNGNKENGQVTLVR